MATVDRQIPSLDTFLCEPWSSFVSAAKLRLVDSKFARRWWRCFRGETVGKCVVQLSVIELSKPSTMQRLFLSKRSKSICQKKKEKIRQINFNSLCVQQGRRTFQCRVDSTGVCDNATPNCPAVSLLALTASLAFVKEQLGS